MAKPSGLGKGLSALLGDEFSAADGASLTTLPIAQIENHAGQRFARPKARRRLPLSDIQEYYSTFSK